MITMTFVRNTARPTIHQRCARANGTTTYIYIKRKGGGSFVKVVNTCGMGSLRITHAYAHMFGGWEGPTRASKTARSV